MIYYTLYSITSTLRGATNVATWQSSGAICACQLDSHAYARNDTEERYCNFVAIVGGTPTPERILFRSVLIKGMCNLKDGTRAATAARKANAELDEKYK